MSEHKKNSEIEFRQFVNSMYLVYWVQTTKHVICIYYIFLIYVYPEANLYDKEIVQNSDVHITKTSKT